MFSPEEITGQRFDDALRGYDPVQVREFLAMVAAQYRAAESGRSRGLSASVIAEKQFDDALRGYDKDQVRSFLSAVARAYSHPSQRPGPGVGVASTPAGAAGNAGDAPGSILRTTRGIADEIRAAAEREGQQLRAAAAREAAETLEGAWREMEALAEIRLEAEADAATIRTRAENDAEAGRAEAERIRGEALADADRIRAEAMADANRIRAEAKRASAEAVEAAKRQVADLKARSVAAAEGVHSEAVAEAQRIRANAEDQASRRVQQASAEAERLQADARRAAEEVVQAKEAVSRESRRAVVAREKAEREATQLRDEAHRELLAARSRRLQAERQAAALREAALEDAARIRRDADEDVAIGDEAVISIGHEAMVLLGELQADIKAVRSDGGRQLGELVRRLEDQIGAAVGEIHEELEHSGPRRMALLKTAEERIRRMGERLSGAMSSFDEPGHRDDADEDVRAADEATLSITHEAATVLRDLLTELSALQVGSGHHLAELVRRLEDQIAAAVGEIHEELEHSGAPGVATLKAAEERIREMGERLAAASRAFDEGRRSAAGRSGGAPRSA